MSPTPAFPLQDRLEELIHEHDVPGASAAIRSGNELTEAAAGITNLDTGVEVTTDTVFQIGSITKVYTATLVMQLVDEGAIDLDQPVTRYLPDVRFGDPTMNDVLTVRQFLCHTSGLEGDYFEDFGRGDDAIARYVAAIAQLPQLHPPEETLSYCNSGWVLLGHLVERLVGEPFHKALRSRLTGPADLRDTMLLPEEVILRRVAVGHVPQPDGEGLMVAPVWCIGQASSPAGTMTCATAADVVRFAGLHLDEGQAPDGTQLLSPASVKAMQQPQARIPDTVTFGDSWGLGWFLMPWENKRLFGHDGGTIGQAAYLRVCPEADLAVSLLTNGGAPGEVFRALFDEIFRTYAGVGIPPRPTPLEDPTDVDLSRYEGRYERLHTVTEVELIDGTLMMSGSMDGPLADLVPPMEPAPLTPTGDGVFLAIRDGHQLPIVFYSFEEDGRPRWVHFGARANRRVG